ncbi:MAG: ABC-2 family transporter protein [Clostridiales bacterium]|nr:ABC-2 family transporter protein [Clostridiales bacterium]
MKNDLKVYLKYIKMRFLSGLEYKGWWLAALNVLFTCVTDPLSTILMFARMGNVGEWSMERILLIYALAVCSFGLAETFCRGFDVFPWAMIQSGNFDRLLLRPRNLAVQVAGSVFHIHRLARVAFGLGAISWALVRMGVAVTPFSALVLVLALAGGFLTYCGVFVLSSGIAFFTIKALDWIFILTNASYQVTRVPMDYMPRLLKRAFTFVMPVLLISYYPASVVCGWGGAVWPGLMAAPVGAVFLVLSTIVWKAGVRHYKSTGS